MNAKAGRYVQAYALPKMDTDIIWQELIAHFSYMHKDFDHNYVIVYKQVIQGPKDWASLIATAKRQTVRLKLRSRR